MMIIVGSVITTIMMRIVGLHQEMKDLMDIMVRDTRVHLKKIVEVMEAANAGTNGMIQITTGIVQNIPAEANKTGM
jgi:hypothetical protein